MKTNANGIKGQYRQGDVLVERVDSIPQDAVLRNTNIVAYGEATGHNHSFGDGRTQVLEHDGNIFARLVVATPLEHQEHATIVLPPGDYRITLQREYTPQEIRRVQD
jgi:hypothetical protein